jgi:hypothetical protein
LRFVEAKRDALTCRSVKHIPQNKPSENRRIGK